MKTTRLFKRRLDAETGQPRRLKYKKLAG